MKYRLDHCKYLIHYTRGDNAESAYQNLIKIIEEKALKCGNGFIKGGEYCICFTETPKECLTISNFLNSDYFKRYSPFGVMFSKEYIYSIGGRPVIYGNDQDFEKLDKELRFRFVKFDLLSDPKIDFTWEREWRLNNQELNLDINQASIILPDNSWVERLKSEHYKKEVDLYNECECKNEMQVYDYSQILDIEISRLYFEEECPQPNHFQFKVITLLSK